MTMSSGFVLPRICLIPTTPHRAAPDNIATILNNTGRRFPWVASQLPTTTSRSRGNRWPLWGRIIHCHDPRGSVANEDSTPRSSKKGRGLPYLKTYPRAMAVSTNHTQSTKISANETAVIFACIPSVGKSLAACFARNAAPSVCPTLMVFFDNETPKRPAFQPQSIKRSPFV